MPKTKVTIYLPEELVESINDWIDSLPAKPTASAAYEALLKDGLEEQKFQKYV